MVPKVYAEADTYCQLIPNDTEEFYEMIPRLGAFEISINGVLLFSKLQSGAWPHNKVFAAKAQAVVQELKNGGDISHFTTQNNF